VPEQTFASHFLLQNRSHTKTGNRRFLYAIFSCYISSHSRKILCCRILDNMINEYEGKVLPISYVFFANSLRDNALRLWLKHKAEYVYD